MPVPRRVLSIDEAMCLAYLLAHLARIGDKGHRALVTQIAARRTLSDENAVRLRRIYRMHAS